MPDLLLPRDALDRHRAQISAVLADHGVSEAGVFGPVARGLTGLSINVVGQECVLDRARRKGIGYSIPRNTVPP